ncbi:MAG: pentapeptide repeat-containing protein, partial [Thiohalomonadales bacterium]
QVSFAFFLVSGITIIISTFVYLVIRFEELDKIKAPEKIPYIFNSTQRATQQVSVFIIYLLGPITVLMFADKANMLVTMDRLSAVLAFFIFISILSYKKRSKHQLALAISSALFAAIFVYLMSFPLAVRLFETRPDLVGANLKGVQLENYRLRNALFNHTRFTEATIIDTSMENIAMWGSKFDKASIYNTEIKNSVADYANFNHSIIRDVTFKNVTLKQAQFNDAILFNVSFIQMDTATREKNASKDSTTMDLSNTEFNNTILVAVNFDNTILSNANFYDTDLESVSFNNAVLARTNFSTARNLSCEKLQQARITEGIIKPAYLRKCKLKKNSLK